MQDWLSEFKYDSIGSLLQSEDYAIIYFTKKDLLEENVDSIENLWDLPEIQRILEKQDPDGSWKPKRRINEDTGVKYRLIETWRQLRVLIQQYEMEKSHIVIRNACEYVFSCQNPDGDIRGILANQYAPYYTGAIMFLLVKASYHDDPRIERGFKWLLKMRQDDGGWVIGSPGMIGIPDLTRAESNDLASNLKRETVKFFDKSKPFSAAGTGMVLRAFSVHPSYKNSEHALKAAELLKSKLFQKDNWTSFQHPDYWLRFQYPFWWNNLVSALDSLSLMGFSKNDNDIKKGLKWLIGHQGTDGLWKTSYSKIHKTPDDKRTFKSRLWITLAICRIFKRFNQDKNNSF